MHTLPDNLYTAAQTREIDRSIIKDHHISGSELMSRAAKAALDILVKSWPQTKHIIVLCGGGNNGGDGYDLAHQAINQGFNVDVIELGNPEKMREEAFKARQVFLSTGQQAQPFNGDIKDADVLVDALFGTGLDRPVAGEYAKAIEAVNAKTNTPVLSIDIPSGLNADTGKIMGVAVRADVTVSFLGLNQGLFTGDGPNLCGCIYFNDLDAPDTVYETIPTATKLAQFEHYQSLLSPRARSAHKGDFGDLLVVGGNQGMSGAARICAEAGARTGAGLISIATHPEHANWLNIDRPELMVKAIHSADDLTSPLAKASVISFGPGLSQNTWSESVFNTLINTDKPMVIDADALNLLSQHPHNKPNWILTPHPGEASRLLGTNSSEIEADRFQAVKQIQQKYGGVVVLKGAGTLMCDGQTTLVSTAGNPGMASGGMGDALTGIIGGLLAQQMSLFDAASLGVILHGLAADRAAKEHGERGLLALDLLPHLRHLLNLK